MRKIRIMIAGTRCASFRALARMLERASEDYDVIDQVWGEAEARRCLRESGADIVLVDASVSEAFELCAGLTEEFPHQCVALVGGRHSYEWLKQAMDAGARSYITEDDCTVECIRAEINRVLRVGREQANASDQISPEQSVAGKSRAVVKAVDFVRQSYRRNISVAEAAEYAGISESHLRRCFRRETGLSFVDFLTQYRIDAAKILLDKGEMPVHRISDETGFSSSRYFCRVFKKLTDMTPKEYILKRNREDEK